MSFTLRAVRAKPFLKWVGGKRKLLSHFKEAYPSNFNNYLEPFVGGGAVFFNLLPEKAVLNDVNNTLIEAYKDIRDNLDELCKLLFYIEKEYLDLEEEGRKEYFYNKRDYFNSLNDGDVERTAFLVFLNKTCFNGLYRVNSSGEFNVPHGRYKNPTIFDKENLYAVSEALQNVGLTSTDFEDILEEAKEGDFVYFDPPYDPLNETSNFTSYSKNGFGKNDQTRLRDTFDKLTKKGCKVMLSNSNTKFINDLYKDYFIHNVKAARSINSKGNKRGKIKEVIVTNY